MKVAVTYGPMDIRVEEEEMPRVKEGMVLVRVKAAGICGSDLHFHRMRPEEVPRRRRPLGGHEYSGEIVEVGPGVEGRRVGDRVGVEPLLECGRCRYCLSGEYQLCPSLRHVSEGFREYALVPYHKTYLLPEHVSYEEAALLDCVAVAVHGARYARLSPAERVAVVGDGAIGISTAQVAKALGVGKVLLAGHHDRSLRIARKLGVDAAFNSKDEGFEEAAREALEGGADVVFETVGGGGSGLETALKLVKPGGRLVIMGVFTRTPPLPLKELLRREIDLIFAWSYSNWNGVPEYRIALEMVSSGKVNVSRMITHRFHLCEIAEGFKAALNKYESGALKVVILP